MAYAVTLKNAGALYQQMYLVATAIKILAVRFGWRRFGSVRRGGGARHYAETSVGEIMLSGHCANS